MSIWNSLVSEVRPFIEGAKGTNAGDFDSALVTMEKIKHPEAGNFASVRGLTLMIAGTVKLDAKASKSGAERVGGTSAVRKALSKLRISDDKSENKESVRRLVNAYDVSVALNWGLAGSRDSEVGTFGE